MVAIPLTSDGLLNVKRALRRKFPKEKSTHLTEALAAACGYRNHAALLTKITRTNPADPDFVLLNDEAFLRRLQEMAGTPIVRRAPSSLFDEISYSDSNAIVRTKSGRRPKVVYKSTRQRAWRNMMVSGINAGIEQRLFTVRAGDNRWTRTEQNPEGLYRFQVGDIPAVASVSDAGWDELSIHVAFWPTVDGERWVRTMNGGFFAGDAYASGWLERRDGAWLQATAKPFFCCRKHWVNSVASLVTRPTGYADRGDFKM